MIKKLGVLFLSGLILSSGIFAQNVIFNIGEWTPYTGEKIPMNGMAAEIVTAACKASGMIALYEFVPWKRAEILVKQGTVFATFPYKETKDRLTVYNFSNSLFTSSFSILINTKNEKTNGFVYTDISSLNGYKIGVTAGTDAVKLPLVESGAIVDETQTICQSIRKLELGWIDFVIEDQVVLFKALNSLYNSETLKNFFTLEKPFGEVSVFKLMVSKKFPVGIELLNKFNDGIATIEADGSKAAILAKYGLK